MAIKLAAKILCSTSVVVRRKKKKKKTPLQHKQELKALSETSRYFFFFFIAFKRSALLSRTLSTSEWFMTQYLGLGTKKTNSFAKANVELIMAEKKKKKENR